MKTIKFFSTQTSQICSYDFVVSIWFPDFEMLKKGKIYKKKFYLCFVLKDRFFLYCSLTTSWQVGIKFRKLTFSMIQTFFHSSNNWFASLFKNLECIWYSQKNWIKSLETQQNAISVPKYIWFYSFLLINRDSKI